MCSAARARRAGLGDTCLPACCVQGRRVAGRERPTASEEKNNLAVGAGWRLSHGSGSGYVKCDIEAQI